MAYPRTPVDIESYKHASLNSPCFICRMASGELVERTPIIYEDEQAIVFFAKHQPLYGYIIVAPRQHREQVTSDFSSEEYLALQGLIYRLAEALRQEVPTERLYILSLGSLQGNRHVHWHIAALPPGIPYDEQQLEALKFEKGMLDIPVDELTELAVRIRQRL